MKLVYEIPVFLQQEPDPDPELPEDTAPIEAEILQATSESALREDLATLGDHIRYHRQQLTLAENEILVLQLKLEAAEQRASDARAYIARIAKRRATLYGQLKRVRKSILKE